MSGHGQIDFAAMILRDFAGWQVAKVRLLRLDKILK